jgi:hypothetical protein
MKEEATIIEEIKLVVAERYPPGDRWVGVFDGADDDVIFECLTEVLEYVYQKLGNTQFYMDAREGRVYIIQTKEKVIPPTPEKTYSLYGEY